MKPTIDGIIIKKKGIGSDLFKRSFIEQYMLKHGSDIKQRQHKFDQTSGVRPNINNIDLRITEYRRSSSTHDVDPQLDFINARINPG